MSLSDWREFRAGSINHCIRQALPQLLNEFQIIHLCGQGKLDPSLNNRPGYCQFEYIDEELPDLFAAARLVISRSGANSLYEILALGKPHVLIPLSAAVSRGDQIQNARYFSGLGISTVLDDQQLQPELLIQAIHQVMSAEDEIKNKIKALDIRSATDRIIAIIKEQADVQSPRTV